MVLIAEAYVTRIPLFKRRINVLRHAPPPPPPPPPPFVLLQGDYNAFDPHRFCFLFTAMFFSVVDLHKVQDRCKIQSTSRPAPRWSTADAEIRWESKAVKGSLCLSLAGVGQNIALHAVPVDRTSAYQVSALPESLKFIILAKLLRS